MFCYYVEYFFLIMECYLVFEENLIYEYFILVLNKYVVIVRGVGFIVFVLGIFFWYLIY